VARLLAAGYGTTELDMIDKRCEALVAAGLNAMGAYLDDLATKRAVSGSLEAINRSAHPEYSRPNSR